MRGEAEEGAGPRSGVRERGRGPPELGVAVLAAEAAGVEDLVVGHQPLHGVDGPLAGGAHLLLGLEAERLRGQREFN